MVIVGGAFFAIDSYSTLELVLAVGALLVFLIGLILFIRYFSLWIQCRTTGADISLAQLVLMSIRKVNSAMIVHCKIMAVQSGITRTYPISTQKLQAHYLAGGNVPNVIRALIAAYRANISIDWQTAQAIDLAGARCPGSRPHERLSQSDRLPGSSSYSGTAGGYGGRWHSSDGEGSCDCAVES